LYLSGIAACSVQAESFGDPPPPPPDSDMNKYRCAGANGSHATTAGDPITPRL